MFTGEKEALARLQTEQHMREDQLRAVQESVAQLEARAPPSLPSLPTLKRRVVLGFGVEAGGLGDKRSFLIL